jgi:hypothetical protein
MADDQTDRDALRVAKDALRCPATKGTLGRASGNGEGTLDLRDPDKVRTLPRSRRRLRPAGQFDCR